MDKPAVNDKGTPATGRQRATIRLGWVAAWLAALVILAGIFYWLGIENVLDALTMVSVQILLASVVVFVIKAFLRLLKWKLVVGAEYGWRETAYIHFASRVGGALLPMRVGEFAPLVTPRYRTAKVSGLIIIDRVFETCATLFAGAISFAILGFHDRTLIVLWGAVFFIISVVFFLLFHKGFWRYLETITRRWKWLSRGFALAGKVSHSLQTMKSYWLPLLLLSLTATILDFIFVQTVFLSLGQVVSLPLVAAAWCAGVLASVVAFTPSGLGIIDVPALYLYRLYGIHQGVLGAQLILTRGISFALLIMFLYIAIGFMRFENTRMVRK